VFLVQKPFRAAQLLRLIEEAISNNSLKNDESSEKIDIGRPLGQYGARRIDIETKNLG
jgi:FixJ family two-component response regulator